MILEADNEDFWWPLKPTGGTKKLIAEDLGTFLNGKSVRWRCSYVASRDSIEMYTCKHGMGITDLAEAQGFHV